MHSACSGIACVYRIKNSADACDTMLNNDASGLLPDVRLRHAMICWQPQDIRCKHRLVHGEVLDHAANSVARQLRRLGQAVLPQHAAHFACDARDADIWETVNARVQNRAIGGFGHVLEKIGEDVSALGR